MPGWASASEYRVPPSRACVSRTNCCASRGLAMFSTNTAGTRSRRTCSMMRAMSAADGSASVDTPASATKRTP
ncbi:Uncharacterised protein [Bordetella pertussis]|nr:Uncharacterised protein [Bordetella pertussis]